MIRSSVLGFPSSSLSPSLLPLPLPQLFLTLLPSRCICSVITSSRARQLRLVSPQICRRNPSSLLCTMQEIVEASENESEFVEVGYIYSVHGLQGEVRIKTKTDFPELRFSTPGKRWLRQQYSGRETIQEIELVEGRGHPGQKSWIVKFSEVNTVDQAQQLVGCTLLVTQDERPDLEEGEFYTRDLVGMRVILKETGEPIGTVVNVFNSGASDLLHVILNSPVEAPDGSGDPTSKILSGPLVWIPFVEAIVPDVDMSRREMLITPPKGLLELNIRSDERTKKERRQLEWKERKKFQKRVIAAKKKLCEMEQQHVFHGFQFGEKAQRSLLADQIVGVNSKLLQQALENVEMPSKRWNFSDLSGRIRNTVKLSRECVTNRAGELQEKGQLLMSKGKVAFVLYVKDSSNQGSGSDAKLTESDRAEDSACLLLKEFFGDVMRLSKMEDLSSVPLILVSSAYSIDSLQRFFSSNDHFRFDSKKVWFLEEGMLPVVSNPLAEQRNFRILMKSPWEMLQTPVGSGGIISLLSSHEILKDLSEMGVEYIEVCSVTRRCIGCSAYLGLVESYEASVIFELFQEMDYNDEPFDMIFSIKFMQQLAKQMSKLQFYAQPKANSYVDLVEKEWVDVIPTSPNSYELSCSIYSSLNMCPPSKACMVEVAD